MINGPDKRAKNTAEKTADTSAGMFFSAFVLLVACSGCGAANVQAVRKSAAQPIERVYACFGGGAPSGIMVRRKSFRPVTGYAVEPFAAPNATARNHFEPRGDGHRIAFLVVHYTVMDFQATVKRFTENATDRPSSSHYVIARPAEAAGDKQLLRVVPENCTAYHAGRSKWGNHSDLNPTSIGLEIVNMGYSGRNNSWEPYRPTQIRIAGLMLARMVSQYDVLPNNVVGHADIAPQRKADPGVMFPWAKLYNDYGVGAWLDDDELVEKVVVTKYKPKTPCPSKPNRKLLLKYLRAYGYDTADGARAIKAFKAHYTANGEPKMYNDRVTLKEMYWIWALVAKYANGQRV